MTKTKVTERKETLCDLDDDPRIELKYKIDIKVETKDELKKFYDISPFMTE